MHVHVANNIMDQFITSSVSHHLVWLLGMLQYCGALFNLGKALSMQGKAKEAAEAYDSAIQVGQRHITFCRSQIPRNGAQSSTAHTFTGVG